MKILMLVNWQVKYLINDEHDIQPPDKVVKGKKYWFFRCWPQKNIRVDVVDYTRLPFLHYIEKRGLKFYVGQALKVLPRIEAYDVIISHGAQSGVLLSFVRSLMGRKYPPHIIIDIGCFNGGRNNILEILPIKFAGRSLSGIIYHAKVQHEYYKKHLSFLVNKTRFIPFGVDTDFFSPLETNGSDYVLAFGYHKRDYKTLCEAWRLLQFRNIELTVIGMNNPHRFGIGASSDSVRVIKSASIKRLKEILANAKFVVIPLPFFNYAYGQMSLLQSMSMGKAVIVTRTPSTIDYVNDGCNAIFVEPFNVEDMYKKIKFLIKHPKQAKELGFEARKSVLEQFNERIMAAGICNFIRNIV